MQKVGSRAAKNHALARAHAPTVISRPAANTLRKQSMGKCVLRKCTSDQSRSENKIVP